MLKLLIYYKTDLMVQVTFVEVADMDKANTNNSEHIYSPVKSRQTVVQIVLHE